MGQNVTYCSIAGCNLTGGAALPAHVTAQLVASADQLEPSGAFILENRSAPQRVRLLRIGRGTTHPSQLHTRVALQKCQRCVAGRYSLSAYLHGVSSALHLFIHHLPSLTTAGDDAGVAVLCTCADQVHMMSPAQESQPAPSTHQNRRA